MVINECNPFFKRTRYTGAKKLKETAAKKLVWRTVHYLPGGIIIIKGRSFILLRPLLKLGLNDTLLPKKQELYRL
jgi:hypothetical protein